MTTMSFYWPHCCCPHYNCNTHVISKSLLVTCFLRSSETSSPFVGSSPSLASYETPSCLSRDLRMSHSKLRSIPIAFPPIFAVIRSSSSERPQSNNPQIIKYTVLPAAGQMTTSFMPLLVTPLFAADFTNSVALNISSH